MARPLPSSSSPARSNGRSTVPSLAANLTVAAAEEDGPAPALTNWNDDSAPPATEPPADEVAALREQLAQAEKLIDDLKQQAEQELLAQQAEFERVLDEKSEVIRNLHEKVQVLEQRPAHPAATPREEELMALSEELERERRQLKEDEDALMEQMGQMEVQMSRERAELARQRTDLQRLQGEIRHELELAARDAALRERLAPLQRRHQELNTRRSAAPAADSAAPIDAPSVPPAPASSSGIFRRLFG